MRALTGLKQAGLAVKKDEGGGHLPEIALIKIHVDTNNARRAQDETSNEGLEEQSELTQDIRKRGVKSPVSLRPHPTIAGEYMLNYGHRRLKGAIEAGLATIPYFLDVNFDSYDQVKENLLHRKPSIWALAQFIQRKLDEGQSKGEIADGLGKTNQNLVTELLALVDAPACLHQAYGNGVRSARTLYDLRRAYDDYPEQTEAWCAGADRITRETIRAFVLQCQRPDVGAVHAHEGADSKTTSEPASGNVARSDPAITAAADTPARAASLGTMPTGSRLTTVPGRDRTQQPAQSSRGLRHDVKNPDQPDRLAAQPATTEPASATRWISVEYQGKGARMACDATVQILLDDDSLLDVLVADIRFAKPL